jgi:hypothetical protein
MNPNHDSHEQLARAIDQTLRALPPRRAPFSLEQRVRAEIARRAALPWWRRSFAGWPLPVKAAFLTLSAAMICALVVVSGALPRPGGALAAPLAWLDAGLAIARAIGGAGETVLRSLPPLWLYGGLAFCAAAYAALMGLGAATWRHFKSAGR